TAGSSSPMRIAMIAITTRSSISVNPAWRWIAEFLFIFVFSLSLSAAAEDQTRKRTHNRRLLEARLATIATSVGAGDRAEANGDDGAIPDRPRPPSSLTHRQRPSFGLSLTFSLALEYALACRFPFYP